MDKYYLTDNIYIKNDEMFYSKIQNEKSKQK